MTKILCVEDSEDSLFTLHKRLVLAGFEVKVAMNGAEGVDWAKTLLPDLIVMDLRLPGLDGWEATRRLTGQRKAARRRSPLAVTNTKRNQSVLRDWSGKSTRFSAGAQKHNRGAQDARQDQSLIPDPSSCSSASGKSLPPSTGTRYLSIAQSPRSMSLQRSEQNGR